MKKDTLWLEKMVLKKKIKFIEYKWSDGGNLNAHKIFNEKL